MLERTAALAVSVVLLATAQTVDATVTVRILGDLPGGLPRTVAGALSADGDTVAGTSSSGNGLEVFHWRDGSGLVGLGGRPGPPFDSAAVSVSAGGRFIGVESPTYPDGAYLHDIGPDDLAGTGDDAQILLPLVPGASCNATQVSRDGQTVLSSCDGKLRLWRPGPPETTIEIPLPPALDPMSTTCSGLLSADGSAVVADCLDPVGQGYDTFRWTPARGRQSLGVDSSGGRSAAGVSADGGVVVGDTTLRIDIFGNRYAAPFRWTSTTGLSILPSLPGAGDCHATSVSSKGEVVVGICVEFGDPFYSLPPFQWFFVWTAATGVVDRGFPPGVQGFSPPILSGDGSTFVSGSACTSSLPLGIVCRDVLVWRTGDPVFRSLRTDLAPGAIPSTSKWITPVGVSDDGRRLAGTATDDLGASFAFHVTLDPAPFLGSDSDDDGVPGFLDNCPFTSNPDQKDTGGIGASSASDNIGDACQCGDVSGDGRVSLADTVIVRRSLLAPPTATMAKPALCDVGGPAGCTLADAVILSRAMLAPPAATVQQQCGPAKQPGAQVCGDGVREGTEVCDGHDGCPFSCIAHCTRCYIRI